MDIPWILVATSLIMIGLALPLILKKVPKNDFYGLRTKRTMSGSDEHWYEANRTAGVCICAGGIITFLACLIVPLVSTSRAATALVCAGILTTVVLISIYYSTRK